MTDRSAAHSSRPPAAGERITVALIPAARDNLRQVQERTNLTWTDITNRAITSYAFFDAQSRADHDPNICDTRRGKA